MLTGARDCDSRASTFRPRQPWPRVFFVERRLIPAPVRRAETGRIPPDGADAGNPTAATNPSTFGGGAAQNAAGVWRATLWSAGNVINLNAKVQNPPAGLVLNSALAVSDGSWTLKIGSAHHRRARRPAPRRGRGRRTQPTLPLVCQPGRARRQAHRGDLRLPGCASPLGMDGTRRLSTRPLTVR